MNMDRAILEDLKLWANDSASKPLILEGARQIGKTYILKQLGSKYFKNYHYLNFENDDDLAKLFESTLKPQMILEKLEINFSIEINPKTDLLILDEIQVCPRALTSLKYFCEDMPELKVVAAGSLLGIKLGKASFPVGKVDFMQMQAMDFKEFILALGHSKLYQLLNKINLNKENSFSLIDYTTHKHLWELLKFYFIVGGLPEIVELFVKHHKDLSLAFQLVRDKQNDLIKSYLADIAKHSGKINSMHIESLWRNAAIQLGSSQDESANKFKFKEAIPGIKEYNRIESALDWLIKTKLLIKCPIIKQAQTPLAAYAEYNKFKLFIFDIGILGAMSKLSPKAIMEYDYGTYKGFFAENYAAQELTASGISELYSWEGKESEIEFVIDIDGSIIPIEIKSGRQTKSKSMKAFTDKYHPKQRFIFSAKEAYINSEDGFYGLPLYLVNLLKNCSV